MSFGARLESLVFRPFLPYPNPTRRAVAGAAESAGVRQNLQQERPVSVAEGPVTGNLTCAQNFAGQP